MTQSLPFAYRAGGATNTLIPAWAGMAESRMPGCPRPGICLSHELLSQVPLTHAHEDRAQAVILGPAVEVREVESLVSHTRSTHSEPAPHTPAGGELTADTSPGHGDGGSASGGASEMEEAKAACAKCTVRTRCIST